MENNLRVEHNRSMQTHFFPSTDEMQPKSDSSSLELSHIGIEGEYIVAPSSEVNDNYRYIEEGVEIRSLQSNHGNLLDPSSDVPTRSKVNTILRNVGSTDVLVSTHVSLNLGHLNAVEREDLKSSPVEKKPRKRALTNTDVQSSKNVITEATSGVSTGRKKCSLAGTSHDITSSIQRSRHPAFNTLTTDGVELSTRVSYETDNSQRPQSIVTPTTTAATFANASNQPLVKNNLLEKLLLDVPVVLSTAASGTEELRSSARPESVKFWKASVDDINVENRSFRNFYHFWRSASEPELRVGQQSKSDKLTETLELVVEGQDYYLRELRHGNRKRVTDKSVSSDVKTVPKRYNFARSDIPSNKLLKTNTVKKLIIRQPKYREFSSLEMAKGASVVQCKEELVQEPVSLIRQIVKVHSSVIPPGNKPKVNFPGVLYKPELPPKPVHLSAIGSVRQVHPSCLTNYGPWVKPRGSILVNTASTATLPGAKNQFLLLSNNNNTSHDSTWEQGCANNRPKTVRILNSADNCENGKISDVSAARGPVINRSVKTETDGESQNVVVSLKQKKPASVQNYAEQICSPSPRYEKKKDKSSPSDKYRRTIAHEYPILIHTQKKLSLPSSTLTPCIKAQDKDQNSTSRNKYEGSAHSTPQNNFTSKCLKPKSLEFSSSHLPILSSCLLPNKENLTDRIERITGYKAAEKYSSTKPPLPLHFQNATKARLNVGIRTRIANARQEFLEAIQNSEERKFDYRSQDGDLDKFKAFRRSTEAERARLIASTPDLAALERSVRSSRRHIDWILASKGRSQLETESERSHSESRHGDGAAVVWPSYRQKISQYKDKYEHEKNLKRRSKSFGYLETDIDTLECRQVFETEHERSRRENHLYNAYFTRSLFTLDQQNLTNHTTEMEDNSRARSMDFLLDDDNRLSVLPPENTLNANKTKSEHELRVERSLQNLNIPEWYKNSPWSKKSQEKLILKHNNGKRRPRWQGLGSRTPSSSSIASTSFSSRNLRTPDRSVNTDWRYAEFLRSSRESLTGVSTGSVSPAEPYPLSRWSSTRLSSTSFPVSGWSTYRSFRQPYLGWRAAIGQNSSSICSGVPSPAPSTPLTTSRPVSPGRSFREYQSDYTNLSDKPEIQTSSHHRQEDVKKDDLLSNFSNQLSTGSQHVNTVEKGSNYNASRSNFTKSKQTSLLQYHPTSNSETINGHSGSYHETSRSYNYVRAESAQVYSESTDDGSSYQQSCSTLEKDFTFPRYSGRIYDYPVETSIPTKVYAAESLLSQSSIRPSGEKPHPDCRNRNIYQNKNFSLQKDMFSYQTPVNSSSSPCYLKKSLVNETDYYQSSYLPDEKKEDSFTIVTSEFSHPDQEPRILEDSNTEQKTSMNGYLEESTKALKELENSSLSINHNFGDGSEGPIERNPERDRSSYAQSIYNRDPKRDRFSYIQSIYNGDSIVDKVTKKGSRQPTSDGQQTFVDISQNRNQSQTSSPQRVVWMESSFVGSRPTTSVVVMPANNDKLLFEKTNVVYNTDDENDSLQYQHDLNDFEEKREEVITSLDDVLDALLAIPSSSRSSSPVTSRRASPVASQTISSAQADRKEQPPFFSDWTENTDGRLNSQAEKTSCPTMSVSSCTGSQEPPSRRLSEVSSHGSTTADENRYSSSSAISLEPELEHSLREKYNAESKGEIFRSEERLSSKQGRLSVHKHLKIPLHALTTLACQEPYGLKEYQKSSINKDNLKLHKCLGEDDNSMQILYIVKDKSNLNHTEHVFKPSLKNKPLRTKNNSSICSTSCAFQNKKERKLLGDKYLYKYQSFPSLYVEDSSVPDGCDRNIVTTYTLPKCLSNNELSFGGKINALFDFQIHGGKTDEKVLIMFPESDNVSSDCSFNYSNALNSEEGNNKGHSAYCKNKTNRCDSLALKTHHTEVQPKMTSGDAAIFNSLNNYHLLFKRQFKIKYYNGHQNNQLLNTKQHEFLVHSGKRSCSDMINSFASAHVHDDSMMNEELKITYSLPDSDFLGSYFCREMIPKTSNVFVEHSFSKRQWNVNKNMHAHAQYGSCILLDGQAELGLLNHSKSISLAFIPMVLCDETVSKDGYGNTPENQSIKNLKYSPHTYHFRLKKSISAGDHEARGQKPCYAFSESGQQEEPSPLKPPDTKHLRHSFPETAHQATSSSVISKRDSTVDEPHQQRGTITCNRPKCTKTLPVEEGRVKFRMCPNCYTYYCSRHCRKIHWDRHKNQCPYTKISNLCQQVLVKVRQDPISRRNLSVCARRGYLSRGRGAVKLVFYNTEDALDFMCKGWNSIRGQNFYVPRGDLMPQEMGADMFTYIRNLCDRYNPGKKFVLLAAVRVTQEISSVAGPLIEREIIIRGTKMRLTPPLPEDDVQMVILTLAKHPGSDVAERHRQCLAMENHLQERGINIATEFPDMYAKIKNFVKGGEPFVPLSVFLTDRRTAKMFMCIILPWADAEIIQNISAKAAVTKSKRLWML